MTKGHTRVSQWSEGKLTDLWVPAGFQIVISRHGVQLWSKDAGFIQMSSGLEVDGYQVQTEPTLEPARKTLPEWVTDALTTVPKWAREAK